MIMSVKPQRFKTASGREIIDLGAVFDNEAAHGSGPVILNAAGLELAADGTTAWKIGTPLIIGVIESGSFK
jgi:hypothetical protein